MGSPCSSSKTKDHTLCGNYRPIALLNSDLKLFSKILANRIFPFISLFIHADQVGFVPQQEARDNITKAIDLIHTARSGAQSHSSIHCSRECLQLSELVVPVCPHVVCWSGSPHVGMDLCPLLLPYSYCLGEQNPFFLFPLSNDTRQDCPLCPHISILNLEPLLCKVRTEQSIKELQLLSTEYKIAAYADNLLFFIMNPESSLHTLFQVFAQSRKISNFSINYWKSEALNISLPSGGHAILQCLFPFQWFSSTLRCLGIRLNPDLAMLNEANFSPLLARVRTYLKLWLNLTLTLFGRCNTFKITSLLQILYIQTTPIRIPQSFFVSLCTMLTKFIRRDMADEMRHDLPTLPKQRGSYRLTRFARISQALHLFRIVTWYTSP